MIAKLLSSSPAKSHDWSPLNELINKISCLNRPSFWNLALFDNSLFGKNLLSYSSPISSDIGSSAHHKLENNDSESIIINLITMILFCHNLWRHIAWRSTCISTVFFSKILGYAKIRKVKITYITLFLPLESKTKFSGLMSL